MFNLYVLDEADSLVEWLSTLGLIEVFKSAKALHLFRQGVTGGEHVLLLELDLLLDDL
jgi:hypothetical protein